MQKLELAIAKNVGKRKTSVAKAFLFFGTGQIFINEIDIFKIFNNKPFQKEIVISPFILLNCSNKYDAYIYVKGGGVSSQAEAIRLALSKTLGSLKDSYRVLLKHGLFLKSDSRIKERRKYGLKKARKASQYSKR